MQPEVFTKKLQAKMRENNSILKALGAKPISFAQVNEDFLAAGERLRPFVANTVVYLHEALQAGKEFSSKARRGRSSTSITGLIRMSLRRTRLPAAPASVPAGTGWIACSG